MRLALGVVALSTIAFVACAASTNDDGISNDAASKPDGGTSSERSEDSGSASPPSGDLGKSCAGGCAGADICTVGDEACASGHCLFDGRSGSEAYCTADCSSAPCPAGFTCEDVPFALERACVRKAGPTPGGTRVRATVDVKGAFGPPGGSASPYHLKQTFDTSPPKEFSANCGAVWVQGLYQNPPMALVTLQACDETEKPFSVRVALPIVEGTYPGDPAVKAPLAAILIGLAPSGVAYYGSIKRVLEGPTLALTSAAATASPFKVTKIAGKLTGTLPANDDNRSGTGTTLLPCNGSSCAAASASVTVSVDIELTNWPAE